MTAKVLSVFISLVAAASIGLAPYSNVVGDVQGKNIVCYYSSWSAHRPGLGSYTIDDIPINMCTHLVYSFIGLNNRTWELLVLDPINDITKGGYRRFTSLKKRNSALKTLISVGGWVEGGQKYSEMASKPERRKVFVNSVVDFLKWFNFDGLDLDWEFPGSADRDGRSEDKENFVQLVQELREAFDKEGWGWSLTAVVPIMPFRVDTGYQVEKLASMLDHIHLLTYDLRGNWTGFADVHTPLRQRDFDAGDYKNVNMNDGVELWERLGAPRQKLTIGLALYGRTYTLADPAKNGLHAPLHPDQTAGNPGLFTKANGTLAYYEICELQRQGGWEQKYDEVSESAYMVKGDQWVGYDDRESLVRKIKHFQDKDYGGVAVWAVDLDDFQGTCGEPRILLNAIYKQVTGRSALSVQSSPPATTAAPTSTLPPITSGFLTPSIQDRHRLPTLITTTVPPPVPTVFLTPSRPTLRDQHRLPIIPTTTTTPTQRHQETIDHSEQTPSTLSFFEDSQRLHPKIDHFRTTVAPVDVNRGLTLTPDFTADQTTTATIERESSSSARPQLRPGTRRPILRQRQTTPRVLIQQAPSTIASVPRLETVQFQSTNVDVSPTVMERTEPTIADTFDQFDKVDETSPDGQLTTTTAVPITRRPFGGSRPLRTRGRPRQRPAAAAVAPETDSQTNHVATRNRTRPINRQLSRSTVPPTQLTTTETIQPDVTEITIPITSIPQILRTKRPIKPASINKIKPIVTTAQPAVQEQSVSDSATETSEESSQPTEAAKPVTEAITTTTTTTTRKPIQRRLRRPVGNRTASRIRRPLRNRLVNQTETALKEEESIQTPVFIRYPSPRVNKSPEVGVAEGPRCTLDGPKYHPHRLCDHYWECSSHKSPPTLRTCQTGLVWNPQTSICDWLIQNTQHKCE